MANELYQQRIKNLIDSTSFREPEKVPTGIEFIYWPLDYAGVTLDEVVDDPIATAAPFKQVLEVMEIDFFMMAFGLSHPIRTYEALGAKKYRLADDKTTIEHIQTELDLMTADEYDDLINDYVGFTQNVMPRRNYTAFQGTRDEAYTALKKAAAAYKIHMQTNALIAQEQVNHQIVSINPMGAMDLAPSFYAPFNTLFDNLRGMKEALIDLRRRPEKVRAAINMLASLSAPPMVTPDDYLTKDPIPASWTIYHSECFLNNQQFDELFFQPFKKQALPYMEKGAKYFLKGEGLFLNTLDRYRELPKGSMIILLDQDDPFEAYKLIGDYQTLVTGINMDLLKGGTKQQCIDYVKRCFDTFAPGGGFIFAPQKPLISAGDVKTENLLAVFEFANEYGKK